MSNNSRKVQYWVTFSVALATMTSSVSFSWITPVIPKFHNNETAIAVNDAEIAWIVVMTSPGMIVGTIASRFQSDIYGRRSVVLSSAVPFFLGTMLVLLTTKVWIIYIARFLWGVGAGMIQTVSMIYIAEIASKEIRGSLVVCNRFMFQFGSLMVITVGSFVSYHTLSYMLIILPAVYFCACWRIPETPYFLLKEENIDAARKGLMKLNGYKNKQILEQKLTEMRKHVKEDMRRSTTAKELFTGKRYRKALIISIGVKACQIMSGLIPFQQYMGRILQETESSLPISTALILYAGLRFIVSMLSSTVVDRVGRRPLLIYSYIGASLSLAVIGICFFIQDVMVIKDYANLLGNVIFGSLLFFSIVSTMGYSTIAFVIPAEIFPLNVKSIAMTSMNLFGSVTTFIVIKGFQLIMDLTGLCGAFWFFGTMCLFSAIFSYCIVPETRGKSLREIQIELQGPLYEEESEKGALTEISVSINQELKEELKPLNPPSK